MHPVADAHKTRPKFRDPATFCLYWIKYEGYVLKLLRVCLLSWGGGLTEERNEAWCSLSDFDEV